MPGGVNLIGYLRAESGVGQIGRSIADTLHAARIPFSVCSFDQTRNRQEHPLDWEDRGLVYDTNILCVNADQVPVFYEQFGDIREGRRTIGVWAWEVDVLPAWMAESGKLVDEVWGISEYSAACIRPWVECPVKAFPLPVNLPSPSRLSRQGLGLPQDPFLFLFCFDYDSVVQRKNPRALIKSYLEAFPAVGLTGLLLKTINGNHHPRVVEDLRQLAEHRRDVYWIDGFLSPADQSALIGLCDSYVSLHRAEGFGLTIAEAMSFGVPVIATAFSANSEFMNENNSYPIPFSLVTVGRGADPYPAGAKWAEPEAEAAVQALIHVASGSRDSLRRGRQAHLDIVRKHSPTSRARLLHQLLFGESKS